MAMKSRALSSFVMFDVTYEDGTRTSNRKVPATALGGLDGDEPARGVVEAQDREIEAASGYARGRVKALVRSPVKTPEPEQKARGGKR
jgi:hypothetical protein